MSEQEEVYSFNGELYYEDLEMVIDDALFNNSETILVANKKELKHSDFLNPHLIIEEMQERVYTEYGEYWGDSYLENLKKDDLKELGRVINDFLVEKSGIVKFYGVENPKEVNVFDACRDYGIDYDDLVD